jgi:cyclophilin family peptidyl-prolyl cis-trans isomerase
LLLFDLGQNGAIYVELLPEAAPVNTAALREAVRTGYFDGEYFYRVIETHVAQAGREFDQRLKDVPRLPLEAERDGQHGRLRSAGQRGSLRRASRPPEGLSSRASGAANGC